MTSKLAKYGQAFLVMIVADEDNNDDQAISVFQAVF